MDKMHARLKNIALLVPEAAQALYALKAAAEKSGLSPVLCQLVELRASQINGCSVCVDMHSRQLKKAGEADERIFTVAAWREAPYFSEAERAALGLAEAVTRLSDREDPVPEAVWNEAARHYDEAQLAALVIVIANINVWNRLNAATKQPSGAWTGSY